MVISLKFHPLTELCESFFESNDTLMNQWSKINGERVKNIECDQIRANNFLF